MLNTLRVIITGDAGSLGQARAARARELGARVVGVDIAEADGVPNVDEYHRVDLLDRGALRDCFARLGTIDALCNIAGGFAMGDTAYDPESAQWSEMFKMNVETVRNATMAAVPLLLRRPRGAIVNVGANAALKGIATMSAYCCSKAAVMRLTESLSGELRGRGINVNAVLPSVIDTPANRAAMPDADWSQWVTTRQLADVICFLASPGASGVHGALIPVVGLS